MYRAQTLVRQCVDIYYRYFRHEYFNFLGQGLPCFYHEYNSTRLNERQVEVPIIRKFMGDLPPDTILEIGNVMSHYGPINHRVIDKFEQGQNVITADATTYDTTERFRLIFSISTFEHIGYTSYGEEYKPEMLKQAIDNAIRLLAPGGIFVFTGAIGYNPNFDKVTDDNSLFDHALYYKRINGVWTYVHKEMIEYLWVPSYDKRQPREVFIGIINKER